MHSSLDCLILFLFKVKMESKEPRIGQNQSNSTWGQEHTIVKNTTVLPHRVEVWPL